MNNKSMDAFDLYQANFQPKSFYLSPLLFSGALGMIHARAGVGKTNFALWLTGAAAAHGEFLNWKSERQARVLYVDGEMTAESMQGRLRGMIESKYTNMPVDGIRFICCDFFDTAAEGMPRIDNPVGQSFYERAIIEHQSDVIVFDNFGALTSRRPGESDVHIWDRMKSWIIKLRAARKAVIIIHHSGKQEQQLGSSEKEQPMNWIIKLARARGNATHNGARFIIQFEKKRDEHFTQTSTEDFEANMITENDITRWQRREIEDYQTALALDARSFGCSVYEISRDFNIPVSQVRKILRKQDGLDLVGALPY